MQSIKQVLIVIIAGAFLVGCTSAERYTAAVTRVDLQWKKKNDRTITNAGQRTFTMQRRVAFSTARRTLTRLGMVIEAQDFETGFLFASAAAPVPLTEAEWNQVKRADTGEMRTIAATELGPIARFAKLDPVGKEVLVNVFILELGDRVEVTLGLRLRNNNPKLASMAQRSQAPPLAVKIGIEKFWHEFDGELKRREAKFKPEAAPIKAKVVVAPNPEPSARSDMASRQLRLNKVLADKVAKLPATALNPILMGENNTRDAAALIVGVADYRRIGPAAYADRDALYFAAYSRLSLGVPVEKTKVLTNDKASLADLKEALKIWLPNVVHKNRTDVIVVFAGHGLADSASGRPYLLPYDGMPALLADTGLPIDVLFDALDKLQARSVTIVLDSGFDGATRGRKPLVPGTRSPDRDILITANLPDNFSVLSAHAGPGTSSSIEDVKHGRFNYHLMKGLEGEADANRDQNVTVAEAFAYAANVTGKDGGAPTQFPVLSGNPDTVLAYWRSSTNPKSEYR